MFPLAERYPLGHPAGLGFFEPLTSPAGGDLTELEGSVEIVSALVTRSGCVCALCCSSLEPSVLMPV